MSQNKREPSTCAGCKFAAWDRTEAGRLHPKGQGQCRHPIILDFERQQAEANAKLKAELQATGEWRDWRPRTAHFKPVLPIALPNSVMVEVVRR